MPTTLQLDMDVLVVSDSSAVRADVNASVGGPSTTTRELTRGSEVLAALADRLPDLVVLDMQIGKMGGVATCLEIRLEEGAGRLEHVPVLMLLDRRADVFLARTSGAEGWLIKPLDPIRLSRAVAAVTSGGRFEDTTYQPVTVAAPI